MIFLPAATGFGQAKPILAENTYFSGIDGYTAGYNKSRELGPMEEFDFAPRT